VYIAVGNDRQWVSFTQLPGFEGLAKPEYVKNAGRIKDVKNLNDMINAAMKQKNTDEMIELCNKATIAISRVNTIEEVIEDPYVKESLLTAMDPLTKTQIWMAPPPVLTPFLKEKHRTMTFPPRFGQHNKNVYGSVLGLSDEKIGELMEKGII